MQIVSSDDLKRLRELLLAEKANLLREPRSGLDALTQPACESVEDQAALLYDQFVALHFCKHEHQKLRKIEAAFERLRGGDFGICQACEEPILRKRLLAIPWADRCVTRPEQLQNRTAFESEVELAA
jgi:DnaK suppressor protein